MSGVSLAVSGPEEQGSMTFMGSLRVIELQLVAFVLVFSASGLVPLLDLAYSGLISIYLMLLARFAFPSHGHGPGPMFHGSRLFQMYVVVGTVVGLFLPLAYVLGGFARGDKHAVQASSPHLFLLSFQILSENVISRFSMFSAPVRAMVPLMYTVRRIFVDIDWVSDVWLNQTLVTNANLQVVAKGFYEILQRKGRGLCQVNGRPTICDQQQISFTRQQVTLIRIAWISMSY
ncbi:uncharacterized protein LOC114177469 isoform X2 [Vigna unguiculata]|uniref:uncharacterized protein LOC114177469 isoform X2 n=1 Tax=Vigna unguiculata TaxID=3917 RepID=UPI001016A763|nr:uncharacterized protein LOC114177469 isoform X2 [Vigna unguiculata]